MISVGQARLIGADVHAPRWRRSAPGLHGALVATPATGFERVDRGS